MTKTHRTGFVAFVIVAFVYSNAGADVISTTGHVSLSYSGGLWNVNFSAGTPSGAFAPLSGTNANVADVTFGGGAIPNFMTFAADPSRTITLTGVSTGTFGAAECFAAPASKQSCTPAAPGASSYNFVNQSADSSSASLRVTGTLVDATGTQTGIDGTLTTQFADMSYQEVLAVLFGGGSVAGSYSAVVTTAGASPQSFSVAGTVALSNTGLDFQGPALVAGFGDNRFQINSPSAGAFSALVGTGGTTLDLTGFTSGAFALADFMTFDADPNLSFDLESILPGTFGAADCFAAPVNGQECTPPVSSAFNLSNNSIAPLSSTAAFAVQGSVNALGGTSPFSGLYTFQFGLSYQHLLDLVLLQGGTASAAYSAQFITGDLTRTVPEPSTLLLIGGAVLGWRQYRLRMK